MMTERKSVKAVCSLAPSKLFGRDHFPYVRDLWHEGTAQSLLIFLIAQLSNTTPPMTFLR